MAPAVADEVESFLGRYDPAVRDVALRLRTMVLRAVPDAEEKVHLPWKTIAYGRGGKFCAISPHSTRVNLQFHRGADLPDPEGLLEGTGKSMRHVKVGSEREARAAALRRLVKEAVARAGAPATSGGRAR